MKSVNQEAIEHDPQQLHEDLHTIWGNPKGLRSLTIVNHTTLGLRFMVTGMVFFLIGGILAMLVRTQLAMPDQNFMSPDIYNQVTTMHGTVMMYSVCHSYAGRAGDLPYPKDDWCPGPGLPSANITWLFLLFIWRVLFLLPA